MGLEPLVPLEGRQLLSSGHAVSGSQLSGAAEVARVDDNHNNRGQQNEEIRDGRVVKAPNFYELYLQSLPAGTAPRNDLNVRKASAELKDGKGLVLTGTMDAKIDLTQASVFVWGFDRNGNLGPANAPFPNRPNIRFDAVVVVQVAPGGAVTGSVRDLTTNAVTAQIPTDAIKINGRKIEVTVADPATALPSTGRPLSQYTFNLWPRVGLGAPSTVVSFAPENAMAPIGTEHGRHQGEDNHNHQRGRNGADDLAPEIEVHHGGGRDDGPNHEANHRRGRGR